MAGSEGGLSGCGSRGASGSVRGRVARWAWATRTACGVVAGVMALGALGCGGPKTDASESSGVNAGLAALASGTETTPRPLKPGEKPSESELAALARQAAIDLQSVLDEQRAGRGNAENAEIGRGASGNSELASDGGVESSGLSSLAANTTPESLAEPSATAGPTLAPAAANSSGPAETDLVGALRQKILTSSQPFNAALSLAALAASDPAAAAELDNPESPVRRVLSPAELRTLEAVRQNVRGVAQGGGSRVDGAQAVPGAAGFRIARAALCTSVAGFGQYTAFKDLTFTAGRPVRAILYIELDGFTHKTEASGEDGTPRWSIEVSRELSLYSGGLLVWHRPPESVREVSLNQRRDFYLVEEIVLPSTLGVGRFELKITTRDLGLATTPIAEVVLPVRLVSEPVATR